MAETAAQEAGPARPPLSRGAIRRLLGLLLPYRAALAGASLLMLLASAAALALPLAARLAVDRVLSTGSPGALDRMALQLVALNVLTFGASFGEYLLVASVGNRLVRELRARLFAHLQRLPVAFFDRSATGELVSSLNSDVGLLQQGLTDDTVRLLGSVVTLAGGITLAVVIDARLTAVVVTLLAATLGIFVLLGSRVRRLSRRSQDALAEATGALSEALSNVRLVKAFAREEHEDARYGSRLSAVLRLAMRSAAFEAGLGAVGAISFVVVLIGVFWYGGRRVLAGELSAGSLLGFLMTVAIIGGPMGSLAGFYTRLQRAAGAAERVFALLDEPGEPADPPSPAPLPDGGGRVLFREIHFAYVPGTPVLADFSLELPPGGVTALVGESGAGKSTVAALLFRFYDPQEGCILLDGVPLAEFSRRALRETVGIVPQDPVLFQETVRENIRYGRLDASDEEVEAAARAANVHEFAARLPKGYDTLVGERGVTLSGGQRQRVAIARALLKDPRVLVLDEATSALDVQSERLVREALERLMRGRTVLVIAHRLSTVRGADQIAVLEGGSVVERGTHEKLVRQGGRYAVLCELDARRGEPHGRG